MKKILGLDIGSNSIGWALVEEKTKIIDLGVRIFPVGVREDDYNKSGTETSKSTARRDARMARRVKMRYALRRKQLKGILAENGMTPSPDRLYTSKELYALRKDALDGQISLEDIGRIFLLLNQRRGFKSSKKDQSNDKETSKLKKEMSELETKVYESGARTIGEYFYNLFVQTEGIENWHNPDEPLERIRKRFVYRKMYEAEFDLIWNKQREYYPQLTGTPEESAKIKDRKLSLEEKKKLKEHFKQTLYYKIKEYTVFYQRPLKSAKHLVAKCRFEPNKRVAPKSSFIFQEFRIWQTLANLKVTDGERIRSFLTLEEKILLADELMHNASLSQSKLRKKIGLSSRAVFEGWEENIKGNTTATAFIKAFGTVFFDSLPYGGFDDKGVELTHYRLWHTLFFATDDDWLYQYSQEVLGLTEEQAAEYSTIVLEPDYSSISQKAAGKILPFLKEGLNYADACQKVKEKYNDPRYHHSYSEEEDSKDRILVSIISPISKEESLGNPLVEQALSETIKLVNAVIKEYGKPDEIKIEFARGLKKPKGEREKIKSRNDDKRRLREEYEVFLKERLNLNHVTQNDILKYELWLEMGCEKTDVEGFAEFVKKVSSKDKEKYRLYLECGRVSPYTGKIISLEKLFSPQIQVEHIIPYSKCMDNSFANKTLCEDDFNLDKSNSTPFELFKHDPIALAEFKERIKAFPDYKQDKFLADEIPSDFLASQLTNTAYIAREARKKLKTVCRDVRVVNGQATSQLRRIWGLNRLLNDLNEKNRDDHRHHAVDALVIAFTNDYYINILSQHSQLDDGRLKLVRNDDVPKELFPYPAFKLDITALLSTTLTSYRNKKRLVTKRSNKYIHSASPVQQPQKSVPAIRGSLHEETYYGRITNPHTNQQVFVVRKDVSSFTDVKQIEKIIDTAIKKIILEHIDNNGGKVSEALKTKTVYMYSRDEKKKIPIKKVRIASNDSEMIPLREGVYVPSGNNYSFAIYEDSETGKREYECISFYQASQRALKGLPVVLPEKNGKELILNLKQRDLVVWYKQHPDEIDWENKADLFDRLYRVVKFDKNGIASFALHNYSNVKVDKPKEYPEGVVLGNRTFNTIKAVKVEINNLGKIVKVYDKAHPILRQSSLLEP